MTTAPIKPEKLTPRKLVVGEAYLHRNGWGFRTVMDISPDRKNLLYMRDSGGQMFCSCAHFVEICPTVATEEDIERIKKTL